MRVPPLLPLVMPGAQEGDVLSWDATLGRFVAVAPGASSVPDATTSAAGKVELATDGEVAAGVVVQGNDGRLSNARTPTSHSHANVTIQAGSYLMYREI